MKLLFWIISFFSLTNVFCQDYSSFKKVFSQLNGFSTVADSAEKNKSILAWITGLRKANQIPFVDQDSVLFIYRGEAHAVSWVGDFNGWGYDKSFPNQGKRINQTNLWFLKTSFPKDARLDYKILLNHENHILDPENRDQQWSGLGGGSPNSELRMPLWKEDPDVETHLGIPTGTLTPDILFTSKILEYQITYRVYLPPGVANKKLDCIYVTDGYEYLHPQLGNMETILNNMIAEKKIKPVMAVFVDHREPINRANNKRMQELAMNESYLNFFVKELIPAIEAIYPAKPEASGRAILGTSMGGLTATYFVFKHPDVFGMAGIQSPAFYIKPQIYQLCNSPANSKIKISMTTGLINDTGKEARKMKDILEANSCEYHYREVNEGHSWGNWRNLISRILTDFFAEK